MANNNQAQIDKMQAQIAELIKERDERGDRTDPVGNAVTALQGGLGVLAGMHPSHDLNDLIERAASLDAKTLNADDTASFNYALDKWLAKHGPVAHDFAYVVQLAEDTHQAALDKKATSGQDSLANKTEDETVTNDEDDQLPPHED